MKQRTPLKGEFWEEQEKRGDDVREKWMSFESLPDEIRANRVNPSRLRASGPVPDSGHTRKDGMKVQCFLITF
jgi:hypothetical protein